MKKVTKAVIPAAGLGTRVLPATKAMPKGTSLPSSIWWRKPCVLASPIF